MPSPGDTTPSRQDQVEDFIHDPLDTSDIVIRVSQVLPTSIYSMIQCRIEHQTLVNDGHVCLSYMLGSDGFPRIILVNGRKLRVHRNLWHFLAAARRMRITNWLWVDAICIYSYRTATKRLGTLRFAPQFFERFNFTHLASQIWQYILPCFSITLTSLLLVISSS